MDTQLPLLKTDNAGSVAKGPSATASLSMLRTRISRVQWTAPLPWLAIGSVVAVVLLAVWALSPETPRPAPLPRAPQEFPLKPHHYWAIGTVLAFIAVIAVSLHIGTLALSGQTLKHRRNVVLGGVLLVLAELFNVDALKALSVDPGKIPLKSNGTQFGKDEIVYGVLALFIAFSYIEYLYNFVADYIKALIDFRKTQKDSPLAILSPRGIGRIAFDIPS